MTNFRQKAEEYYARYKETSDPAEAAASDAYNEAADEFERLAKKLAEAEAMLRNTLLHYDISDVHFLDSAPTRPDDKNGNPEADNC